MSRWKRYTVKAGENETKDGFPFPIFGKTLSFSLRFNESCLYTIAPPDNSDFSKAVGFKEGFYKLTDKNSARIGWRPKDGLIELAPYVHRELPNGEWENLGKKDPEVLYRAQIGEIVSCSISIVGKYYVFIIAGNTARIERGKGHWFKWLSRPYVGGDFTLPNDVSIEIVHH